MLQGIKQTLLEVIQAMLPITLVIVILQFTVIEMPVHHFFQFLIGAVMAMAGMTLFLLGVTAGLFPMGKAIGAELPRRGSLPYLIGIAFVIGFTVTIAEPNVLVLGHQINVASEGNISKNLLIYVTAIGIGFFVAMAMVRILFGFPITYLFAAGYAIVLVLSFFTPPEFMPIAFDAGGFSTGLMTIPFILATGLGLSSVLGKRTPSSEGFGIVGLACLGPIIGIMALGVISR